MPRTAEDLAALIEEATRPGFRGQIVARGLARNLIWSAGQLPSGSPAFSPLLSSDLISYGLGLFEIGLRLRNLDRRHTACNRAFERAGEAIESIVRDGDPAWNERGFYSVIAAAAYHLGHFSARAFSLLPGAAETLNLSPAERALTFLIRRNLGQMRAEIFNWAAADGSFDDTLAALLAEKADGDFEQALQYTLNSVFHRALARFDFALETGSVDAVGAALLLLNEGVDAAAEFTTVPFWWIFTIARHLLDDLWDHSLHTQLPNPVNDRPGSNWRMLRQLFIAQLHRRRIAEIDLWPSQLMAATRAFDMHDDLVAALPTSAGKTRIAELCILRALSLGSRIVFVTPLRALSAQTEQSLRRTFTPLGFSVSSLYGASGTAGNDIESLHTRDIVVSTPEKLDFALRNDPELLHDVALIVLDEAHTIGAGEREVRYEVLVQRLLRRHDARTRRIVCLSAILPHGEQLEDFVSWIRQDEAGEPISCDWRPTRQRFGEIVWNRDHARLNFRVEGEQPFVNPFISQQASTGRRRNPFPWNAQELCLAGAWRLVAEGQTVLVYCPERRSVMPLARLALSLHERGFLQSLLTADASALRDALNIGREWLGEFHPAVQCLNLGIAVHHAQLPRPFLRAIEQLLRKQILKVTIASPTLAQGLNLSATTVLFRSLTRAGERIKGEEFANVAGRAGRAFVDVEGQVLSIIWERKHLNNWNLVLRASRERDLRSGLLQLILEFCRRLAAQKNFSTDEVIAYVTGNAAAWNPPTISAVQPMTNQEEIERKWRADLACIDSAILSLVQHDVPLGDLARAVDDALQSSLWQRSLKREDENSQRLAWALLRGRANFIWQNSTPAQRKGYFFAGVSFSTGRYLDEYADTLDALLQQADAAFAAEDLYSLVAALIPFAEIVFAVEPFAPEFLRADWTEVLRAWVAGERMSDLAGGKDAELLEFIEGALVYRLVWAMEAIRVRAAANRDEGERHPPMSRAAAAVETGTPTACTALLIQTGLPSRVAAVQAIRDCPAQFRNMAELREWLSSDQVFSKQREPEWPTPDTASLWRDFVRGIEHPAFRRWEIHEFELPVEWLLPPPEQGEPVRVIHNETERDTAVYSIDLRRLGRITPPFSRRPAGILVTEVSARPHRISGWYLGPRDLVRD